MGTGGGQMGTALAPVSAADGEDRNGGIEKEGNVRGSGAVGRT